MPPVIISLLVFVGVTAIVGVLAFTFRERTPQTATRLEMLVGKRNRDETRAADILRKRAFETDKRSFLETVMPKFLSVPRLFEQADCHIKPGTRTGIGALLAALGVTVTILLRLPVWLAPINGLVLFSLPWVWLYVKRAKRLKKFAAQLSDALELVARALRSGQSLAAAMH